MWLGRSLHAIQDYVAHGDWDPRVYKKNGSISYMRWHGKMADAWGYDFSLYGDGILRDQKNSRASYGETAIGNANWRHDGKMHDKLFVRGHRRQALTEKMTKSQIERYSDAIRQTQCWCIIFSPEYTWKSD